LAKSIGTRFIATGNISAFSKIIWLTPALKDDYVLEAILSNSKKSLNIIGSKDRFYEQRRIDQLEQAGVKSLIIADADHGLDIDHDLFRSLDNMKTIMTSILEFVKDEKRIEIV
ncbi:MAG: hypothetical protein KDD50_08325, partial [Bdellovibrionales bacterium]|nr:hypothetical protein [Bdellovibrionales bacterium]